MDEERSAAKNPALTHILPDLREGKNAQRRRRAEGPNELEPSQSCRGPSYSTTPLLFLFLSPTPQSFDTRCVSERNGRHVGVDCRASRVRVRERGRWEIRFRSRTDVRLFLDPSASASVRPSVIFRGTAGLSFCFPMLIFPERPLFSFNIDYYAAGG